MAPKLPKKHGKPKKWVLKSPSNFCEAPQTHHSRKKLASSPQLVLLAAPIIGLLPPKVPERSRRALKWKHRASQITVLATKMITNFCFGNNKIRTSRTRRPFFLDVTYVALLVWELPRHSPFPTTHPPPQLPTRNPPTCLPPTHPPPPHPTLWLILYPPPPQRIIHRYPQISPPCVFSYLDCLWKLWKN